MTSPLGRPPRPVVRTFVAGLAVAATLAVGACSGGGDDSAAPSPSATGTEVPTSPVATQSSDIDTRTTSSALPVPKEGPKKIKSFPVPPGVRVKGPGPQEQSWQFDIATKDPESVLAFYRKALRRDGYTIENDVDIVVGVEQVHYDIQFTGPARGYIVSDPDAGSVFVAVESLPRGDG